MNVAARRLLGAALLRSGDARGALDGAAADRRCAAMPTPTRWRWPRAPGKRGGDRGAAAALLDRRRRATRAPPALFATDAALGGAARRRGDGAGRSDLCAGLIRGLMSAGDTAGAVARRARSRRQRRRDPAALAGARRHAGGERAARPTRRPPIARRRPALRRADRCCGWSMRSAAPGERGGRGGGAGAVPGAEPAEPDRAAAARPLAGRVRAMGRGDRDAGGRAPRESATATPACSPIWRWPMPAPARARSRAAMASAAYGCAAERRRRRRVWRRAGRGGRPTRRAQLLDKAQAWRRAIPRLSRASGASSAKARRDATRSTASPPRWSGCRRRRRAAADPLAHPAYVWRDGVLRRVARLAALPLDRAGRARPAARRAARQPPPARRRPCRARRAAVGRARHRQVGAGQGGGRGGAGGQRGAGAGRGRDRSTALPALFAALADVPRRSRCSSTTSASTRRPRRARCARCWRAGRRRGRQRRGCSSPPTAAT